MRFLKTSLCAFSLFVSALGAARAEPGCTPDGRLCLEVVQWDEGGGFDLWAESRRACVSSVSLEAKGENLGRTRGGEAIYFVAPGRTRLFSQEALVKDAPWRLSFTFHAQCGRADAVHNKNYLYSIPVAPRDGAFVSQGFHGRFSHADATNAYAVDFEVPEGTPVYAARGGTVVQVIQDFSRGGPEEDREHANVVRIEHPDHTVAEYAHLRRRSVVVKVGQRVRRGTLLAKSGNTGRTTGPHLHFAVHVPVDGRRRRSVPVSFLTEGGGRTLEQGRRYLSSVIAEKETGRR